MPNPSKSRKSRIKQTPKLRKKAMDGSIRTQNKAVSAKAAAKSGRNSTDRIKSRPTAEQSSLDRDLEKNRVKHIRSTNPTSKRIIASSKRAKANRAAAKIPTLSRSSIVGRGGSSGGPRDKRRTGFDI